METTTPAPAIPKTDTSSRLTVMVVDDTKVNRIVLESHLKKLGYNSISAENGAEAVDKFSAERPDIILMDAMMPVMDGMEATRRIKPLCGERWVPIIFITALSEDKHLVDALESGGDDYLYKPVSFPVLKAKLAVYQRSLLMRRHLEEARMRAETIAENIVDGIIVIDEQGIIQSCNAAAQQIFGYHSTELCGVNIHRLMPEPYRSAHDGYLQRYRSDGRPRIIGVTQREVEGVRKNGEIFPMELGVSEIRVEGARNFLGVIRDITPRKAAEKQLRTYAENIENLYAQLKAENDLARDVMSRQMRLSALNISEVHYWFNPTMDFSGDAISVVKSPTGGVYALLADATGHGLSAAITTVPLLTVFNAMVERGASLQAILREANQVLRRALPTGRFVAATLLHINMAERRAELWIGGMPDVLLISHDGRLLGRFNSNHLPLGILDFQAGDELPYSVQIGQGNQFVLYSDGIPEAQDPAGESFGDERLKNLLIGAPASKRLHALQTAIRKHTGCDTGHDDMTLLLLGCTPKPG